MELRGPSGKGSVVALRIFGELENRLEKAGIKHEACSLMVLEKRDGTADTAGFNPIGREGLGVKVSLQDRDISKGCFIGVIQCLNPQYQGESLIAVLKGLKVEEPPNDLKENGRELNAAESNTPASVDYSSVDELVALAKTVAGDLEARLGRIAKLKKRITELELEQNNIAHDIAEAEAELAKEEKFPAKAKRKRLADALSGFGQP